jgi:uncharacterized repeat protein (TIGR03803 family)
MVHSGGNRGWTSAAMFLALTVCLAVGVVPAQAQTFSVIYNFKGSPDAANPWAGLTSDSAGNLYGTTLEGGSSGYGTIFKATAGGSETVLHAFDRSDGESPYAGLLRDKSGDLYGATFGGGDSGFGVLFKLSATGKLTVLHSFTGKSDGCYPFGGVISDSKSNLYGTASSCGFGYGTLWKVDPAGKLTVLHSFAGGANDGAVPEFGSLVLDKQGNLYGFASEGGTSNDGVVYEFSKSGKLTLLYSFAGGTGDGCYPLGTPVMDENNSIYGTTELCGSVGNGVIWKLTRSGAETVLHNFAGGSSDGSNPFSGVLMDAKGNLYGTTEEGGADNDGVVYKLAASGALLHSFSGSDGALLLGALLRASNGDFYGVTYQGGKNQSACGGSGCGTVFRLK